jgi:hypothetical protein
VCLAALLTPLAAHAVIGAIDRVPGGDAADPYFEVDLDDADGKNTR